MTENEIAKIVIDCCFKIHTSLGPGLSESVYDTFLCKELENRGLNLERQKGIDVYYEGLKMEMGFSADIIVERKVILELKSHETLAPVHLK
jgi:GxxExxY protein